jgi:hypothetical protein
MTNLHVVFFRRNRETEKEHGVVGTIHFSLLNIFLTVCMGISVNSQSFILARVQ